MKIGIISDTHGSLDAWQKALEIFRECDLVLHAGDILNHGPKNPIPEGYNPAELAEAINKCEIPVMMAKGNCDSEVDQLLINLPVQSPYILVRVEGKSILVTHGHLLSEKGKTGMIDKYGVDIFISGHTHIPNIEKKEKAVLVNPGSPSIPLTKEKIPTVGIIEEENISIINLLNEEILGRETMA